MLKYAASALQLQGLRVIPDSSDNTSSSFSCNIHAKSERYYGKQIPEKDWQKIISDTFFQFSLAVGTFTVL